MNSARPSLRSGRGRIGGFGRGRVQNDQNPLIYPLPDLELDVTEFEIWEGVYQGVLIADFRIYVPMLTTCIQTAVPGGSPPSPIADSAQPSLLLRCPGFPRVTNKVFPRSRPWRAIIFERDCVSILKGFCFEGSSPLAKGMKARWLLWGNRGIFIYDPAHPSRT